MKTSSGDKHPQFRNICRSFGGSNIYAAVNWGSEIKSSESLITYTLYSYPTEFISRLFARTFLRAPHYATLPLWVYQACLQSTASFLIIRFGSSKTPPIARITIFWNPSIAVKLRCVGNIARQRNAAIRTFGGFAGDRVIWFVRIGIIVSICLDMISGDSMTIT